MKKKYSILLKIYNVTSNSWNDMTERYSDCKVLRQGKCISFEGTEEEFDKFYDELLDYSQENLKVIGVYED